MLPSFRNNKQQQSYLKNKELAAGSIPSGLQAKQLDNVFKLPFILKYFQPSFGSFFGIFLQNSADNQGAQLSLPSGDFGSSARARVYIQFFKNSFQVSFYSIGGDE